MSATCVVAGCGRATRALDLCHAHYQQFYLYGKILPRPIRRMNRYNGASCSVSSCTRTATDNGYCNAHYMRLRNCGDLMVDKPIRTLPPRRRAA